MLRRAEYPADAHPARTTDAVDMWIQRACGGAEISDPHGSLPLSRRFNGRFLAASAALEPASNLASCRLNSAEAIGRNPLRLKEKVEKG
jgi:hypothetical protein